ncbi:DUF4166 domain-containing protein [Frigidibacter sp. RF13]|uniref:SDR family oxidoreductase n=1 Tax=Frigidibacter sp. RF13 TaxID=2997340 RepID=UPI00226FFE3E|nr:SDR family oxidoreductase [Frigidibacter sp. RF13]MCY1128549.1 DUF4166 domain-containing protein [Frigidibacter sp. RF13]
MSERVLVLGGYGVFGGLLCRALARVAGLDLIVAGRSLERARAFCATHGGRPAALDRDADGFADALAALKPKVVIDAAGPFQSYGTDPYGLVRLCLKTGAHYLDLSDDGAFTAGIGRFDAEARAAGLVFLSGVSSVPALSSAAVESLRAGLSEIHLIETAILPGNRAPRGRSVVAAILAQAGRPVADWRGGRALTVPGWGWPRRLRPFANEAPRWASAIGAPDILLFHKHFGARSVRFRAGLELKLLHGGLWGLGWLVRLRLIRDLTRWTGALTRIAGWFERFGSDRGAMEVTVIGATAGGVLSRRCWRLMAEAGDGTYVPTLPARAVLKRLRAGRIAPGARACLAAFDLDEIRDEIEASGLTILFERQEETFETVFQQALGPHHADLPPALADLHRVVDLRRWSGRGSVARGRHPIARFLALCLGFPPASPDVAVMVEMERRGKLEHWLRRFGDRRFRSVLSVKGRGGAGARERFGPMSFDIALAVAGELLSYPVTAGRFLGLPLPRFLLPVSETSEGVDERGRATFDVKISHPVSGLIVHYRGWLSPDDTAAVSP